MRVTSFRGVTRVTFHATNLTPARAERTVAAHCSRLREYVDSVLGSKVRGGVG
jgi:hypothetical protein